MPQLQTSLSVVGLLVFGTTTSLFAKIVYELQGEGRDGKQHFFTKPWAMTTVMFLGMSLCLPFAYWEEVKARRSAKKQQDEFASGHAVEEPLLGTTDTIPEHPEGGSGGVKEVFMLAIPTAFDLVATVLMNIGLLSVTASVYQMMRGAEMLFAATFAVIFLKRSLNKYHYGGILCCVIGITLVGLSSLLSGEGSSTHEIAPQKILLGMGLIVASQCVQAAQITFEDYFMADLHIAPLKIVGFEGVFGSVAMIGIMLPAVYFIKGHEGDGIHEDTLDTLHMITHSKAIAWVLLIDMLALLMYNFAGMCVTGALGAVFRTVLETMRTLFVWLVDLLLFYTPLGFGTLGESWSRYSLIQAAGFAVLVCGTLIYRQGEDVQEKIEAQHHQQAAIEDGTSVDATPPLSSSAAQPVAVGRPGTASRPMSVHGTPTSFKATMNLMPHASSYSRGGLMSRSMSRYGSQGQTPRMGSYPGFTRD